MKKKKKTQKKKEREIVRKKYIDRLSNGLIGQGGRLSRPSDRGIELASRKWASLPYFNDDIDSHLGTANPVKKDTLTELG